MGDAAKEGRKAGRKDRKATNLRSYQIGTAKQSYQRTRRRKEGPQRRERKAGRKEGPQSYQLTKLPTWDRKATNGRGEGRKEGRKGRSDGKGRKAKLPICEATTFGRLSGCL